MKGLHHASIAIQFGEDDSIKIELVIKIFGYLTASCRSLHRYEENVIRLIWFLACVLHPSLCVDMKASGCIEDQRLLIS
jgi:hypothetical protein